MTHFLCVHSPLTGPATWEPVASRLEARGHTTAVPRLRALGPPYWTGYVDEVVAHVSTHGGPGEDDLVLVGHSGAGALLPPIGTAIGVDAYLFVDAVLPRPDTSNIATMHPALRAKLAALESDGMLPPWHTWWDGDQLESLLPDADQRQRFVAELEPVPAAVLDEVVPTPEGWPDAPCGYLRLSDAYELEEAHAARSGWAVSRIDGSHLDIIRHPEEVAVRLLALLVRLGVPA